MEFARCRSDARPARLPGRAMIAAAVVTAAFTALTSPAYATEMDPQLDRDSGTPGRLPILMPPSRHDTWPGGSQSLPYGDRVDPSTIISAARNLAAVQPALGEFLSRGYIRRPDLDYAKAQRGYAVAVLAFEKPGVRIDEQQACIEVITRPLIIDGVDCPATQVFGGMLRDSAGYVVPADGSIDRPLIVVPDVATGANGAIPDPLDEDFVYKYSAREDLQSPGHFQASMSPGALSLYNSEARTMLNGEMEGLILGSPGGPGLMIFGGIVGMTFAARQFWINPPDTCGCGHQAIEAAPDVTATPAATASLPIAGQRREWGAGDQVRAAAVAGANSASIDYQLAAPGLVDIRVLDVQGRVVKDLGAFQSGLGAHHAQWDLTDATGHRAAAGVYFVSLRVMLSGRPERRQVRQVVIAR